MVLELKNDIKIILQSFLLVYNTDKKRTILRFVIILIQSLLPIATLLLLKNFIDAITQSFDNQNVFHFQMGDRIIYIAVLYALVSLTQKGLGIALSLIDEVLSQLLIDHLSSMIQDKSTSLDMAYYDNSAYHDTFHKAQQEAGYRPIQIMNNLTSIVKNGISFIGVVAILSSFSIWLLVIVALVALPSLIIKIWSSRLKYNWQVKNTPLFRRTSYYGGLMTHRMFSKEIRIFGLASHLKSRFFSIRKQVVSEIISINRRMSLFNFANSFIDVALLLSILVFLGNATLSSVITIGAFVMYFEAYRRAQGFMGGVIGGITGLYTNKLYIKHLFEFLKLEPNVVDRSTTVPFPSKNIKSIKFRNVSFKYPGSKTNVLDNLSFNAELGKINHIEGINGSGKTTMLKLLARFYDEYSGLILINHIDIRDFKVDELRKNVSIIFQDFVQYDLKVKENIGFGDIENLKENAHIQNSAAQSGATKFISRFPDKFETMLGKYFAGGEELSMGQWQKVALARALFSAAPIILLDEPVSWMDAESAYKANEAFKEIANNKLVIMVSHHMVSANGLRLKKDKEELVYNTA